MKNRYTIFMTAVLFLFFGASIIFAQNPNAYGEEPLVKKSMIDVHAGYLNPKDIQKFQVSIKN